MLEKARVNGSGGSGSPDDSASGQQSRPTMLVVSALDVWSMGDGRGSPALWQTLRAYTEAGWHVIFISGNIDRQRRDIPGATTHRFDAPLLKRLSRLPKVGIAARALWWLVFQIRAAKRAWRYRRAADVVYAYEVLAVPVARFLATNWHIPLVTRFQGTVLSKWLECGRFPLGAWAHVAGLRTESDLTIMTDDGTQGDRVLERLGREMSRVRFWMNGVDCRSHVDPTEGSRARMMLGVHQRPVLLTVSRLVRWKRVDRAIAALPDVLREYPDATLLVAGDGPELKALRVQSERLGVGDSVRFLGAVPQDELPAVYSAADVFLSLYELSNVGNPLLEAMCAGKCIITVGCGDTGKVIENGRNGIVLEESQLHTLPVAIIRMLADEHRRNQLGEAARAYALQRFVTWSQRMNMEVSEVMDLVRQQHRRRDPNAL